MVFLFKIKIDSYHEGACIVDLKVMRDFEPVWKEGQGKLHFIEAWGYDIQELFIRRSREIICLFI